MLLAWHAHCHVVNSGVPSVENGKGGGGGGLKVEVVCFFIFLLWLVTSVSLYTLCTCLYKPCASLPLVRQRERHKKKSYAFFSSFLIRSTNAHFTVTVEKKKKRRGECRRPKYLVPRQQHTIQRSSLVTVVGAESRTGITERQWTELGMTGGAINWSSIPSDNRSQ